jgi:hypothetical protein
MTIHFKALVSSVARLAQMDPQDEAVTSTIEEMTSSIDLLMKEVYAPEGAPGSFGEKSLQDDADFVSEQISQLKAASDQSARNFTRISSVLAQLVQASEISKRPQYASIRPAVCRVAGQLAGIFSEVDTTADLDKELSVIEKAVHALYGDKSVNSNLYPERHGKGHYSDKLRRGKNSRRETHSGSWLSSPT